MTLLVIEWRYTFLHLTTTMDSNMICTVLFILLVKYCLPYNIQVYWMNTVQPYAGVGNVVDKLVGESPASCSIMCANHIECIGVNYFLNNETCTLLHVEDTLDDWEKSNDNVAFMCMDCEPGLNGEYNLNLAVRCSL